MKTVVCIPGGGVRGIISAVNIKQYVDQKKLDLEKVDLFSGTSTGSIIAAALAIPNPYSPSEIMQLYKEITPKIFKLPWFKPKWAMRAAYFAPYDINRLRDLLNVHFRGLKLGDVQKNICITAFSVENLVPKRLETGTIKFQKSAETMHISNLKPPTEEWLNIPLADIVAGSCAAPGYFWPHRFKVSSLKNKNKHYWAKILDGGISDNTGLIGAMGLLSQNSPCDLESAKFFYFGNGGRKWSGDASFKPSDGWQVPRSALRITKIIVPSNQTLAENLTKSMLGNNFHIIEPFSEDNIGLDEYQKIQELLDIANNQSLYLQD